MKQLLLNYEKYTEECENELNILKSLNHKNVIRYEEHFVEQKVLYIITEFAPNGTLQELIENPDARPKKEADFIRIFI